MLVRKLAVWAFAGCLATAALAAGAADYDQPYRPQYHFSPRQHWTNDPNGLVYFDGEYHLFFQYNPFGDLWGHMSWGHAVSRDLLHWDQLPVALPEADGVMIFTGSTVVDEHNSSGFCEGGKPCMVAIYTGHTPENGGKPALQTQNLAYSNDRGRTWTKYSKNPVLDLHMSDFRDPKVFWSKQGKHWVMAVSLPNDHKVRLYGSADLKDWKTLSDFGPAGATSGQWECPELFELPIEDQSDTRWVMKVGLNPGGRAGGSGEQYFVGRFDGAKFTNENPADQTLWTDYGKDCYCALTFNNLPPGHDPVMIGWMDNWQYAAKLPTSPWRGQMTFPRSLTLRATPDGIRLYQQPVSLGKLAGKLEEVHAGRLDQLHFKNTAAMKGHSFELDSAFRLAGTKEVGWKLLVDSEHYTTVTYNRESKSLTVDRSHSGLVDFSSDFPGKIEAPLKLAEDILRLRILVDRCSIEVFADGGQVVSTNLVFPPSDATRVSAFAIGHGVSGRAGLREITSAH